MAVSSGRALPHPPKCVIHLQDIHRVPVQTGTILFFFFLLVERRCGHRAICCEITSSVQGLLSTGQSSGLGDWGQIPSSAGGFW